MGRGGVGAQQLHRLDAVHAGHVDVHQDQVGLRRACQRHACCSVPGAQQPQVRPARDDLRHQLLVRRVVFHIQQGARRAIVGHRRLRGYHQRRRVCFRLRSHSQHRRLHLIARRIVGSGQQVANDPALPVAQRRDRHRGRKAAAVLADVGQLVHVFDAARCLEHQRLETRGDGDAQLAAQHHGARYHLQRIGDMGRCQQIHHVGGCITQHAFSAGVEQLDAAFFVGRDDREVGAVENGALQRGGL